MLVPVRGIAVNTGEQTGDGRYIVPGAVTHAELPLPIGWLVDGDQHATVIMNDPQVGNITSMSFVPGGVAYTGVIDDEIPAGAEALRRMREGSAPGGNRFFVSIDPDDWAVEVVDPNGGGAGMIMLASSGVVPEGQRFDWNMPVAALQRAEVLVAAAGGGDPLTDGGAVVFGDASDAFVARFTRLRVRGLTMCSVSAFSGSFMELDDSPVQAESVNTVNGYSTGGNYPGAGGANILTDIGTEPDFKALPVHHTATTDTPWDGGAATKAANSPAELKYMHAWQDTSDGADPEAKGSYKFPHHAAGTDTPANLNGVRNALSRLPQADIPDADRAGVQRHLQAHLDDANDDGATTAAAAPRVNVAVNLGEPPRAWFDDPALPGPSPLTITREGRILGHVATKYTCHTGYTDRCVRPPMGGSYDRFHVGSVACSDGTEAAVGVFAWGIPHADLTLNMIEAWQHYADARYGFGRCRVGEDDYGIWFSGAMYPGINDNDVSVLRSLSISGDWRKDPQTGRLSFIAALAVNFPGFPIPRTDAIVAAGGVQHTEAEWDMEAPEPYFRLDAHGEIASLVACGRLAPPALTADCGCDDGATLKAEIAALTGRIERFERIIGPLYPTIASSLDERVAKPE